MQSSLYVSLSAQMALMRRIEAISNNVANSSTAGFRAEEIKFEQLISSSTADPTAFVSPGITYLSRSTGEFVKTDNPFDVGVKGDAWLSIQTPAGNIYTRDGRMKMTPTGELQTLNGYPVLDVGGSPVQLNPAAGAPSIAPDGTISQRNRQIGALGLFTIPETANLNPLRELRRDPGPAGDACARLQQGRRQPGLRRALERQPCDGDLQVDHGATRFRFGERLDTPDRNHAQRSHPDPRRDGLAKARASSLRSRD